MLKKTLKTFELEFNVIISAIPWDWKLTFVIFTSKELFPFPDWTDDISKPWIKVNILIGDNPCVLNGKSTFVYFFYLHPTKLEVSMLKLLASKPATSSAKNFNYNFSHFVYFHCVLIKKSIALKSSVLIDRIEKNRSIVDNASIWITEMATPGLFLNGLGKL